MATSLDMSLDDMIRTSRNSYERVRGRGRGRRGRGLTGGTINGGRMMRPYRGGPLRVNAQSSSYAIAKSSRRGRDFPWQNDLLQDSLRAAGLSGIDSSTRLYISNLDYGVTNEDIRELFCDGELKRYAVHYDKNGRASGSAEVVYARRSDAFAALKRYNNVNLDGKPMKIEIIGTDSDVPLSARVNVIGGVNGSRRTVVMTGRGSGGAGGSAALNSGFRPGGMGRGRASAAFGRGSWVRSRGALRGGRGQGRVGGTRGRGWGKRQPTDKSAVELDEELDSYHAEAMQTS